ncbi:ribonuclease Z [Flagellimonas halotolerans]|uniref:Ribonuclease Z n=1 Tax=Flagellimonas halotolerans TaxID=3112164 RepID=A0ABU6IRR7_9FLAO|nr:MULTISPECIES: ribonuclease Z [unclassified Allomuricauda]MEC3965773.1 ribonuclease Z [Muricauda sp. SYSU M86414]MEC4265761.1 ribonuclease Z [Muricauda sp. SYSU M84420]
MIFDKDGTTTIVFQEKTTLSGFLENLNKAYPKLKHDNIVVNLFSFNTLKIADLLEFLDISNTHKGAGRSFVLVTDKLNYDEIPEEISVVPTLQEAKDLIEMEEIERDLGI